MKEVRKKNITIFVHCFPPAKGGLEYLVEEIKKVLDPKYEVHVIAGQGLSLDSYKTFSNFTTDQSNNVHRLELDYFWQRFTNKFLNKIIFKLGFFSPFYFGPILKYTPEIQATIKSSDLIIGTGIPTKSFIDAHFFAKKYHKKLILLPTYHNVSYHNNCWFFQKAFDYADKVICLSEKEKTDLTKKYKINVEKINVIKYSPYTFEEINSQKKKLNKSIEQRVVNFKNKKITLGYVGQITERKNLKMFKEFLDKYLVEFKSRGYQLKILLAGAKTNSSPLIEKLLEKYIKNNDVKIIYNFSSKKEIFNKIDIFINPSVEESLGIVNLEAIYYGLPTFINSLSAFADFFIDQQQQLFSNTNEIHHIISGIVKNQNLSTLLIQQYQLLKKYSNDLYYQKLDKLIFSCLNNY